MAEQEKSCANCLHNVFNICKSDDGYYFNGEAISDEDVTCDAWEMNQNSFLYQLQFKK